MYSREIILYYILLLHPRMRQEVTPTYVDIIDNQVTGHEYLRRIGLQDECPIKGRCVRFGWQIDMVRSHGCGSAMSGNPGNNHDRWFEAVNVPGLWLVILVGCCV